MNFREHIIAALDFTEIQKVNYFLDQMQGSLHYVKVGMELFYAQGPSIIEGLKKRELKIFLDLKVHDIPHTVGQAISNLSSLGVDMLNLHAAGGQAMMKAAQESLSKKNPLLLIAVTQLTSTSQAVMNQELGIPGTVAECVAHYAAQAQKIGLAGVVASPLEVPLIKKTCGEQFLTVTPGIRLSGTDTHDQKRVSTPQQAFKEGSDYLVMGRSLTQAGKPQEIFENLIQELNHDLT